LIEADWQREYGLDLNGEIEAGMSWRRFMVLTGGLSGQSRYILAITPKEPNDCR
jgi:hypothetical protein